MMKSQNLYMKEQGNGSLNAGGGGDSDHLRKMFIGGLSAVTSEESLRIFYSTWGDVVDSVVMRDPATKRSRGFGFITYSSPEMVDKAQASRPHVIDGKTVDSKRALPRPEVSKSESAPGSSGAVKKIFVGGLKENHDEQSLTEHFSQFGNVVSVKILTDKVTGRKRGFAFLEFDDYDAVDKAVLHKNHTIKYVLVDVKKSVYKQELAKKLAAAQQNGMMMAPTNAYGQPQASYPQAAYGYPQMTAPTGYNSWPGYAQPAATAYQQPPPAAAPAGGYGAYAPPTNGAAAWNAAAYTAAPATAWGQNGYAAPAPVAPAAPAANGWNAAAAPQTFGDYQQTYNGGPQKTGSLQGNRMNPYSVSSTSNYGI